jgi:hypothetical protein
MYKNVCGRERKKREDDDIKSYKHFLEFFFRFKKRREIIRDCGGGLLLYVKIPRGERKRGHL